MVFGRLVWMNGEFIRIEEAKVSVVTATLHYGVGVFEGIRCYPRNENLCIFRLEDHVERLFDSAKIYGMKIPYTREEICKGVKEIVKANNFHEECYVRLLVYKGKLGEFGVKQCLSVSSDVTIIPSSKASFIGTKQFEKGRSAMISSWRRIAPDSMPPMAKCVANYANSFLALKETQKGKIGNVVFLDSKGFVSEGSGQNIFILKKGRLITPPEWASILVGITRNTIIRLAEDLGYDVLERDITRSELYTAEEVFLCGTAAEIVPVVNIDGITIANEAGLSTRKIGSYYMKLVTGNLPKYRNWLTLVD